VPGKELELVGVDAGYADMQVLHDVSLVVPPGRVAALLGPNGVGKSTVLRTASGLLKPWLGQVKIDGEDVAASSPSTRVARGLCHIPEGRGIFPSLTVRENLIVQADRGHEREAIERAEAVFPVLAERLNQVSGTLSGGQQQMLALARAVIRDPAVVLVDEPSLGLSPVMVDEVFAFLGRLAGSGCALLIVEQYVTRVLAICDAVYVLNRGRVVWNGSPQDLTEDELFDQYVGGGAGVPEERPT
jgi:branched-chain amino acid transport system ATP-binding protein